LQACDSKFNKTGLKIAFFATVLFFVSHNIYSQTQLELPAMPSMPEISTSIEMPTISSVSFSNSSSFKGNFYVPDFQIAPLKTAEKQNSDNASVKNSNQNLTNTNSVISSAASNPKDIVSSLMGNDFLTANDISSLYNSGAFNNISNLSAVKTSSNLDNSDRLLLQKILANLEELKAEQKKTAPAQKQELINYQLDSENFVKRNPSILRFRINGYNIADSLTKVFFSEVEADGSFLVTGDRKYYVNQKQRTETFYILFKAVRSNGSVVTFDVQPSIVQDYKNENSFVYRFSKLKNLTAEKTGDLVVLHLSQNDLNVDLLLDIDSV